MWHRLFYLLLKFQVNFNILQNKPGKSDLPKAQGESDVVW